MGKAKKPTMAQKRKADDALDRKLGIKEGSTRDRKIDAAVGVPDKRKAKPRRRR